MSSETPTTPTNATTPVEWYAAVLAESDLAPFTCCGASKRFLILGTGTNTLYIYDRRSLERLLVVSSAEFEKTTMKKSNNSSSGAALSDVSNTRSTTTSIVHVSISPNEEFVAVADSEHNLHIVEFATLDKLTNQIVTKTPKVLITFKEHVKTCSATIATQAQQPNIVDDSLLLLDPVPAAPVGITCLCWSQNNIKLFCGDTTGHVYEYENSAERRKKSSLFISSRPNRVLKEDGPIVQIHISESRLLVSSTKRAVAVNLKEQRYCGIGTKPRDGAYGACFLSTPDRKKKDESPITEEPVPLVEYIFAARPSRRLWCVDSTTYKVQSTLKYPVVSSAPDLKFELLSPLGPYIVSWNSTGLTILDVARVRVIETKVDIGEILDASTINNDVYVLLKNNVVSRLHVKTSESGEDSVEPLSMTPVRTDESLFDSNNLISTFPVRSILGSFSKVNQLLMKTKTTESTSSAQDDELSVQETPSSSDAQSTSNLLLDVDTLSSDLTATSVIPSDLTAPATLLSTSFDENQVPPLILHKKGRKKKKRKGERLIEFDDSSSNGVKAVARVKNTRGKKATGIDSERSSVLSDVFTSNTDMESQLSLGSEADSCTEISDLGNEDLETEVFNSPRQLENTNNEQQLEENIIKPNEPESEVQESSEDVYSQDPIEPIESINTESLEESINQEEEERKQREKEELERKRIEEEEELRKQEELQRQIELLEQQKREKERLVIEEFSVNVIIPLGALNEAYSEFLLTNENVMWSPDFLPSLHKWAKFVIHSVKQEKSKDVAVIHPYLNSLTGINHAQFSTLLNYWFGNLVEGKIENDTGADNVAMINAVIQTLHEYLKLNSVVRVCNREHLLPCIQVILKIEEDEGYLIQERSQIERIVKQVQDGILMFDELLHSLRLIDQLSTNLRYLPKLLHLNFEKAIAFCASLYPNIQVWNVDKAIDEIIHETLTFKYAGVPKFALYLSYLMSTYNHSSLCSQNRVFMMHLFEEMVKYLYYSKQQDVSFDLISLDSVRDMVVLLMIQAVRKANVLSSDLAKLEQLLSDNMCTDVLFILYEATGDEQKLIRTLVQNSSTLEGHQTIQGFMEHHSSTDNWMTLLTAAQESSVTNKIRIENIVSMMCMIEGSAQALQILKDCQCEQLNTIMYKKICEFASTEAKQNKLKHELLEAVDSYMWSQKDDTISPQIRSLFTLSPSSTTSALSDKAGTERRNIQLLSHLYSSFKVLRYPTSSCEEKPNQDNSCTPETNEQNLDQIHLNMEYDLPLSRYNEDSTSHWGVSIKCEQNDRCSICRLPVRERKGQEIIVFPCGHAFHSSCVSICSCTICQEAAFTCILDN